MRRRYFAAVIILIIILSSSVTYAWLTYNRPSEDALVIKSYPSLSASVQSLLNGEIDILPIDQMDLQTLKPIQNSTNAKLYSIRSFDFTYIGLNLRNSPLNDSDFRSAMLLSFDRQRVLTDVLGKLGEVLTPGLFPSAYAAAGWKTYTIDDYPYDTVTASSILNELGMTSSRGPFRIDPTTHKPLRTMTIISRLSHPDEVATAAIFAKQMQAVGIPVISEPLSDRDFDQSLRVYTFDLFIDTSHNNYAPAWLYDMFDSGNDISPVPLGTNIVGYDNSDFDSFVETMISTKSFGEAQYAAEICQEMLATDLPVFPIYSRNILVAANNRITISPVIGSLEETVRETAKSAMYDSKLQLPLRIGMPHSFQSLDPTGTSDPADWLALHLLTEPLVTYDKNGKLAPGIAKWTTGDATLSLTIQQGAKFDTGQKITSQDVIATLNWLRNNTKPSSQIYDALQEIQGIDQTGNSTLTISLNIPDNFAAYHLTDFFALPANRLSNIAFQSTGAFLTSQALVSSGPFILRQFTQSQGVYMQLNRPYYGETGQNVANIDTYQGSGGKIEFRSFASGPAGQRLNNASFTGCVYDQNDTPVTCSLGTNEGQGSYIIGWQIDSRFQPGIYHVETSLSFGTPGGESVAIKDETVTVHPVTTLIIPLVIVLIIAAALVIERQRVIALLKPPRKRRATRRGRRKRRTPRKTKAR